MDPVQELYKSVFSTKKRSQLGNQDRISKFDADFSVLLNDGLIQKSHLLSTLLRRHSVRNMLAEPEILEIHMLVSSRRN
jgi:hypothetical protein